MAKLRISLYLALISSGMTCLVGILLGARLMTVLYRTCISLLVFSAFGYLIGKFGEQFIGTLLREQEEKGQKVDIVSQQQPVHAGDSKSAFVPLAPEKLERVSRPDK
ncbi:MAG: hypothetical protein ABFC57_05080 [Veillonellales bacterium]